MRTNKKTLSATLLGFSMLLAACSGGGETPEALAFQDDSSGNVDVGTDDGAGDTAGTDNGAGDTAGTDNGAGDGAGGETTNRPTENLCDSSAFNISFPESVVLTDPANSMIADVDFAVPAGTYDIFTVTWKGFTDDPAQTMEQWMFEAVDGDYVSPLTSDNDSELIVTNQLGEGVTIDGFTSIKLSHKAPGMDSANSVHPICIGFRPVAPAATTTTAAPVEETTTTTAAPEIVEEVTTTTAAPVEETTTTTAAPEIVEEVTTTTEAPVVEEVTTTTAAPAVGEVNATTEAPVVEEVTTTTAAPAAVGGANDTRTTTTVARATGSLQGPELALTGPSELATSLGLTGAALVLAGSAAVVAARRSEDD